MSIPYSSKVNKRLIGQSLLITGEPHTVGIVGVFTVSPNYIKLVEVPAYSSPSTIAIPGYNETTNSSPAATEFYVNYTTGYILFNVLADGSSVSVTYYGRGSEIDAVDINEMQTPLGICANSEGALTPNTILLGLAVATNPGSITTGQVDGNTGIVITTSTAVSVSLPNPTVSTQGRFFTVLHKTLSSGTLTVNSQAVAVGTGVTYIWSGAAWENISPSSSTTEFFSVVSSDPVSPVEGQVWFNSVIKQFCGYDGSSIVILG